MLLILAARSPSSAFGQAIRQVRDARSIVYTQQMKVEGKDKLITTKNFIAEDGRKRTEQPGAGPVTTIFDTNGFIRLVLIEPTKTALVSPPRDVRSINAGLMFIEWLEALKKLGDNADKELGEKALDGRRVTGFVATKGNYEFTIWVDSVSGELVSIEHDSFVNDQSAHITMTDFQFNVPLDESLFSFDVPAGYEANETSIKPAVREYLCWWRKERHRGPRRLHEASRWQVSGKPQRLGSMGGAFRQGQQGRCAGCRGHACDGSPRRSAAIPGVDAEGELRVPGQRQDDRGQGRDRVLVQEVGRHVSGNLWGFFREGRCGGTIA